MSRNATTRPWRRSLAFSAACRAIGLSIIGIIVCVGLLWDDGPAWSTVSLVAAVALGALAGIAWYLPRARAEKSWRAALDQVGEQELARQGARASDVGAAEAPPVEAA